MKTHSFLHIMSLKYVQISTVGFHDQFLVSTHVGSIFRSHRRYVNPKRLLTKKKKNESASSQVNFLLLCLTFHRGVFINEPYVPGCCTHLGFFSGLKPVLGVKTKKEKGIRLVSQWVN